MKHGTATHFALRGTLPVWDLLFLLLFMIIGMAPAILAVLIRTILVLRKRYSRPFTTLVTWS
ncbi:hypothetical protein, partial [Arachidicoccus sp.]|uniref:hypothetical protein n=1 Tax=Arachidicoccus sp. TaxID=1872624 RepID=UPI003D1AC88F